MPGAALLAVTAGAGLGWAVGRVRRRGARRMIVAGIGAAMTAAAAGGLAADARSLRHQERFYGGAEAAVDAAGGRGAVLACAPVHTAPYSRPALAWRLEVPIAALSTETARRGTVFRSRVTPRTPVGPPLDPPDAFRHVATAGEWQVVRSCGEAR